MVTEASIDVLDWCLDFDGPWSAAAATRFRDGGYSGLKLYGRQDPPPDLDFVAELPGLKSLYVHAQVPRDTGAFRVDALVELTLVTGSRQSVPRETTQPGLRNLCMGWRPGVEVGTHWPGLERLRMLQCAEDCRWLGRAEALRYLEFEGRGRPGALEGLEACPLLQILKTIRYPVLDSAPLAGLTQLEEVRLLSRPPAPPHELINLEHLQQAPLRRLWLSGPKVLRGLETLSVHNSLGDLRLVDYQFSEDERALVGALPKRIRAGLLDGE
ncbi:hypothetical protein [Isoptericola cucumis]|uniref:Leucine-rich repeat domain-containing protein n=1 Tax=Isoptericola cucumis TaxID=1776856 RepID=A0ABQ2B461_9MICO|nr:hypothetical protein [Isoptericola cucumis]GGI07541.1 hypothetical protein GCM10007368_16680 [Isoptericola cucumis]